MTELNAAAVFLRQLNGDLAGLAAGALPSLVQVRSEMRGVGAGTIWHADGLVITNAHVVRSRRGPAGPAKLSVRLHDGRTAPAQLLACDDENDLAALRVELDGLPAVSLGDARRLRPGDWVLALGHPWGVVGAATAGVVITCGSGLSDLGLDEREFIAASLHLRPGHSGGPLVDAAGRLVGVNTMMNGPDVGVAVPVHVAVAFLKRALGRPAQAAA